MRRKGVEYSNRKDIDSVIRVWTELVTGASLSYGLLFKALASTNLVNLRMQNLKKGSHNVHQLHLHVAWSTKYRFQVFKGEAQIRCRDLIR